MSQSRRERRATTAPLAMTPPTMRGLRGSRMAKLALLLAVFATLFGGGVAIRRIATQPTPVDTGTTIDNRAQALLLSTASSADVIAAMQKHLRDYPNDVTSLTLLGQTYIQQIRENGDPDNYTRADKALHKAVKLDPKNVNALVTLGNLQFARHLFLDSLSIGQQALALNPDKATIYGLIGDSQIELGRYDAAVQSYQTMVNKRPSQAAYSRVSYARELYGDIPGAITAMQAAVDAGGPTGENVAWTQVYLGNLYLNYTGDLDSAAKAYQAALVTFPNYVHATAGMAAISAMKGDYDQAISQYKQVIDQIPLPQYIIALGDIDQLTGKTDDANRAYALVRTEEKLYQANGVDMDLDIALFDADHGFDLPGGLQRARHAMQARPSTTTADVLAWTLFKSGQLQEAATTEQQALRLGSKNALFFFHAGMIASGLGQKQTAIDQLQKSLALNAAASNQPYFDVLYGQTATAELAKLQGGK